MPRDLPGQASEILQHDGKNRQQRINHRHDLAVAVCQFACALDEGVAQRRSQLEAGLKRFAFNLMDILHF